MSVSSGDSNINFNTASANNTNATERMRIDKNGNVGIRTTNPTAPLAIEYPNDPWNGYDPMMKLSAWQDGVNDSGNGGAVDFYVNNQTSGYPSSRIIHTMSDGTGGEMRFATSGNYTTTMPTARLTIKSGGNIGVGTTNPGYKLDVSGDLNLAAGGVYRVGGVAQSGSSKWTAGTGDNIYRTLGKVGVGTGNPTHGKLHVILGAVNGPLALQADGPGAGTDIQWFDNDDAAGSYKWDLSYRGGALSTPSDSLYLYSNTGTSIATTCTAPFSR